METPCKVFVVLFIRGIPLIFLGGGGGLVVLRLISLLFNAPLILTENGEYALETEDRTRIIAWNRSIL
jgi:hypothetical protein